MELTIDLPCTHFRPASMHRPFGGVDHDRHAGDIGFGGDQVQEAGHGRLGVEHALVHVDVDDLRAVFDLLAGDVKRLFIFFLADQAGEAARAGDVGALADVDEVEFAGDYQRLQPAEAQCRCAVSGPGAGAAPSTASANSLMWAGVVPQQPPTMLSKPSCGEFSQDGGHHFRRFVVFAKLVGQPGVGIDADVGVGEAGDVRRYTAATPPGPGSSSDRRSAARRGESSSRTLPSSGRRGCARWRR